MNLFSSLEQRNRLQESCLAQCGGVTREASHISVLEFVDLEALKAHAVKE